MLNKINLNVHGITANLESEDKGFLSFVKGNYHCFVTDDNKNSNLKVKFDPDVVCRTKNLTYLGDGLYVGESSLFWENEFGFQISVNFLNPDCWEISGYHFDLLEPVRSKEEILKNYTRSMRWMLHFPIFSMLDHFRGMRLVHATAISKDQKAMVFAGLNKVGKSTLGRFIADTFNWKYLSDNFLLVDNGHIYAFPEKGRLSPESLQFLQMPPELKQKVYNKYHIPIEPERTELCATPEYVFIVGNFRDIRIERVDVSYGRKMLESLHRYLKEFPEYTFYSALEIFPFWERTCQPLFSEHTEFYRLSFPLNWNLEDIVREINKCISIT